MRGEMQEWCLAGANHCFFNFGTPAAVATSKLSRTAGVNSSFVQNVIPEAHVFGGTTFSKLAGRAREVFPKREEQAGKESYFFKTGDLRPGVPARNPEQCKTARA